MRRKRQRTQQILEGFQAGGLDEMVIETRFDCAAAVGVLTVTGERHQHQAFHTGQLAQAMSQFVAIHVGHGDIGDHDVGPFVLCNFERRGAAVGGAHLLSQYFQQPAENKDCSLGVVDHQNAAQRQRLF